MSAHTNITNVQVNAAPGQQQGNAAPGQQQAAASQVNARPSQGNGQGRVAVQGNAAAPVHSQAQDTQYVNGQGNAAPVHMQDRDTRYVNGQGNAAPGQGQVALQGTAAPGQGQVSLQGNAAPGQGNAAAASHVNGATQGPVQNGATQGTVTKVLGNAPAQQGKSGLPRHSLKILNMELFKGKDKLELENGSVAATLVKLVDSLLNFNLQVNFPNDVENQSDLEKSAYICYAFYEIATWNNRGQNGEINVQDVGKKAVNRAINVLNENMETIPEDNRSYITEYISKLN